MDRRSAETREQLQSGDWPLSVLVSHQLMERVTAAVGYTSPARVFTPLVTLWTWIGQLLAERPNCQGAVAGLRAQQAVSGQPLCSADTGGYCKARQRIPEAVCWGLQRETAAEAERKAPDEWRWCGRNVKIVDGSVFSLADTAANRAEYPLQRHVRAGLSFPVARALVVFSLAVGVVLEAALSPYRGKGTGETGLLRALADRFVRGDVLLGDRYFSGYWDFAFWQARGVDLVVSNSQSRRSDFRRGRRCGPDDHLITWRRTARPDWLTPAEAAAWPQALTLRELRIRVGVPGFRTQVLVVVTTLRDPAAFPAAAIRELYRRRWQAELNLRSLKSELGLEHLRCKTPTMVRKEFALALTAYNALRGLSADVAAATPRDEAGALRVPWQVSFQGTRDAWHAFAPRLCAAAPHTWWQALAETIRAVRVGARPNRVEPYTVKRRPKDYPHPQTTRQDYKTRAGRRR